MNLSTSLFLILLLPSLVLAQERAVVTGHVRDATTREALVAANLKLKNTSRGVTTNADGYFSLYNIKAGSYLLVVSYLGYRRFEKPIEIPAAGQLKLEIQLTPKDYLMDELVVRSEPKTDPILIGKTQIQPDFIHKIPTGFQSDVFRSLQLMPGVKAVSDFSSGLYIRGGTPDQTLILLDGATIYNPSHFFGFFSTFNPKAVKNIQLYKGGYPAKFGGRLGSVLSITNKWGNPNESQASISMGLLSSGASIEGPLKNGSWMFAVRRSTLEPLLAVLRHSTNDIPDSFYFMDINGKIAFDSNADNRFSFSFYNGMDELQFPLAPQADIALNYGNQTFSASWAHTFSSKLFGDFSLTGSRYFNRPSFGIAGTSFNRFNHIYDLSFNTDFEYSPHSNHTISAGFSVGTLNLLLNDEFDGQQIFSSEIRSEYASVYLQHSWDISDHWQFTPGVRINGFNRGKYVRVEPRISLEYHPIDELRFQAAYGRYNQFLTLISNQAFTGFDMWLTAAKGVPPAYGDQYVLGVRSIFHDNLQLDFEVYYRSMKGLFELDPFLPDRAGIAYEEIFHFGEGYAYGAEFKYQQRLNNFTGFLGYTYSISRKRFPLLNKPLGRDGESAFFPPRFGQKHSLSAMLNYEFIKNWSVAAVFNYATGQPYTKPLGRSLYINPPLSGTMHHQLILGKRNASRLPPYHRLDIAISRTGSFWGLGSTRWKLEVINVYSRRNIWFYDFELGNQRATRKEVQLLPLIPSLSYTLNL